MIKKKKIEEVETQYELELQEPWINKFWKFKGGVKKKFIWLDLQKFLKQPTVWLLLVILVALLGLIYQYFSKSTPTLPSQIPLLYNYDSLESRLITTTDLYLLPVSAIITTVVTILVAYKLYNQRGYLSYILLLICSLSLITYLTIIISITNNYLL